MKSFSFRLSSGVGTALCKFCRPLLLVCPVAVFAGVVMSARAEPALRVAASFSVLADLAGQTGGERVEVHTLISAGSDPHTFDPVPGTAAAISRADVILEIGAGFEPWLEDLVRGTGSKARRVDLSQGIDLIRGESPHTHGGDAHDHGGHSHGDAGHDDDHAHEHHSHAHEFDPHFWNDPLIGAQLVRRIAEAFAEADPEGAAGYRERAEQYAARLEALHREFEKDFAAISPENRRIVTHHDSMDYFARRYGLEVVATLLASLTTEAHDPSAGQMAQLVRTIREEKVRAVLPEFGENRKLAEQVARESGVRLGGELYPGMLSGSEGPAATYEALLRHNARILLDALR